MQQDLPVSIVPMPGAATEDELDILRYAWRSAVDGYVVSPSEMGLTRKQVEERFVANHWLAAFDVDLRTYHITPAGAKLIGKPWPIKVQPDTSARDKMLNQAHGRIEALTREIAEKQKALDTAKADVERWQTESFLANRRAELAAKSLKFARAAVPVPVATRTETDTFMGMVDDEDERKKTHAKLDDLCNKQGWRRVHTEYKKVDSDQGMLLVVFLEREVPDDTSDDHDHVEAQPGMERQNLELMAINADGQPVAPGMRDFDQRVADRMFRHKSKQLAAGQQAYETAKITDMVFFGVNK